jgi:uncharacterized protein (UPF0179 family)
MVRPTVLAAVGKNAQKQKAKTGSAFAFSGPALNCRENWLA